MNDKIFTALDYAKNRDGVETVKERIQKIQAQHLQKGIHVKIDFSLAGSDSVYARIWQGHWIADCECGGAEFVDPNEPIFFCWSCGNRKTSGKVRQVIFPKNRTDIEKKILERPVKSLRGLDDMARAEAAQNVIMADGKPLTRSWEPGETLNDLAKQQDAAVKAHKKKAKNGI